MLKNRTRTTMQQEDIRLPSSIVTGDAEQDLRKWFKEQRRVVTFQAMVPEI